MISLNSSCVEEGDLITYHGKLHIVLAIYHAYSHSLYTLLRVSDAHVDEYLGIYQCDVIQRFKDQQR